MAQPTQTAAGQEQADTAVPSPDKPIVRTVVTIQRDRQEVYALWRDPATMAPIMHHFAEVTPLADGHFRWRAKAPLVGTLEWESRIVDDSPGEGIRWASLAGTDLPNEGSIRFRHAPGDKGTEIELEMRFQAPGGPVGDLLAQRLGLAPKAIVQEAVRRFKNLAEAGEIATIDQQPAGHGRGRDEQR